jgi:hypothetical protein
MLLKQFLFCVLIQNVFGGVLEHFKDVMDVSYKCSTTISDEKNVEILKLVDCGLPEAKWDFRIIVSHLFIKSYKI